MPRVCTAELFGVCGEGWSWIITQKNCIFFVWSPPVGDPSWQILITLAFPWISRVNHWLLSDFRFRIHSCLFIWRAILLISGYLDAMVLLAYKNRAAIPSTTDTLQSRSKYWVLQEDQASEMLFWPTYWTIWSTCSNFVSRCIPANLKNASCSPVTMH